MIQELERVVFTENLPEHHVLAGDVGMVVDVHPSGSAYEVEVFFADGSTLDVVTVQEGQIRPATKHEITHVRAISSAEATAR